jgi:hypothetical protein
MHKTILWALVSAIIEKWRRRRKSFSRVAEFARKNKLGNE